MAKIVKQFFRVDSNAKCAEINVEAAIEIEESVICADLANNDTNMNTDTPETDANDEAWAYDTQYGTFNVLMDSPVEWCEFARKLERERDEAVRSCHIWQKGHSDIVAERDLWKAEAERWKTISQTQTTQHNAYPN